MKKRLRIDSAFVSTNYITQGELIGILWNSILKRKNGGNPVCKLYEYNRGLIYIGEKEKSKSAPYAAA